MQLFKTTRNEFSTPNLVELVKQLELNAFSIIFGSKVINVTFVSGGHLGYMQIMPISALRDNASNQNSQKWVLHPQISGIRHAERIYIIFGSKAVNVPFVTGGHLGNMQIQYIITYLTHLQHSHVKYIFHGAGQYSIMEKWPAGQFSMGVNILSDTWQSAYDKISAVTLSHNWRQSNILLVSHMTKGGIV